MVAAALPANEEERLKALDEAGILDTPDEEGFDELVRLAAAICGVPITLVSLIDRNRQWFKSKIGLEVEETPRELAFCAHAIHQNDLFVIPNATEDHRFADNPFVSGEPHIRFYAGMPLPAAGGVNLGTLCVLDREPRTLTPQQEEALRVLGKQVAAQIELRRKTRELEAALQAKVLYENELIAANNRLQEMAVTDSLTRLKNRRVFRDALEREIEASRRYKTPLSLLMIDVDNFKKMNDTNGHLAGDEVLRGIALVLAGTVRSSDLAARYGGEEFAVLMPNTELAEAKQLGQRICMAVSASSWDGYRSTVSIGAAFFGGTMFDSGELIQAADEALYRAKKNGKNCVVCG